MQRSWLAGAFALTFSIAALIGACGSSTDQSFFGEHGGLDATVGSDGSPGFQFPDSGFGEGGNGCIPRTCAELHATCGPQGDGCGNIVDCGTCVAPETCGGGGVPSVCGGNSGCVPKTCADLNANCGAQGDGCGALLPSCGTCTAPEICGGGSVPNRCGAGASDADGGACVPTKTACAAGDCGPISDGCGGVVQCGGCTAPAICGGGGVPSKCGGDVLPDGGSVCTPKTCAQLNATCGPAGDGCGGLIPSCGTCTAPAICGGGGVPSRCGGGTAQDAGACTGLCQAQVKCDGGATTTITGTVVTPRGCAGQNCDAVTGLCTGGTCNSKAVPTDADPIFNALVFIPTNGAGAVTPFTTGVTCDQCGGAGAQGGVLVSATTGADGKFTLTNVPVGSNIPVVVQLGRWRRIFTYSVTHACGNNAIGDLHLPRNSSQGDIPRMALSTGNVDTLECLLRKIGIDDGEFSNPANSGRVHMYTGNGARYSATTPSETTLTGSLAELDKHDMVLFPCWGGEAHPTNRPPQADQKNVIDYTHAGGRLFSTHYSYVWLFGGTGAVGSNNFWASEFRPTATWSNGGLADEDFPEPDPMPSNIDTTFTKGLSFSTWLNNVNALSAVTPPMISVASPRNDVNTVNASAQRWVYASPSPTCTTCPGTNANRFVEHFTFNTPVGASPASQCGRVVFSDFHVTGGSGTYCTARDRRGNCTATAPYAFPAECGGDVFNGFNRNTALTPQEKVLEFMLFDLASCIAPDVPPPPPTCTPRTCQQQNIACGPAGNGCGGLIPNCGDCTNNQTCGGGGVPGQCGGPTCIAKTCAQLGYNCGQAGDGCGGLLSCGDCTNNQNCGGGGQPNVCGTPTCTPRTCQQQNLACGATGDGCGNALDCGPCVPPDTCGGGGTPGQCGHPNCTPRTCQTAGAACGPVADGCGGLLQCGDCLPPQLCGGGGVANQCGGEGPR
jgi:hypothetical protein